MESLRPSLKRDCQQAATRMGVTLALRENRRDDLGSDAEGFLLDGISFDSGGGLKETDSRNEFHKRGIVWL